MRLAFKVDESLWGHLRYLTGKDDTELLKVALACLKWSLDQSAQGRMVGSYVGDGEIKSTLEDDAFKRLRDAAIADPA